MATRVIEQITDDMDGSEGAETVSFSYAGRSYEIDLGEQNRASLEKALEPFIEKARRAGGNSAGRRRSSTPRDFDPAAVRAWARENKVDVPQRGRLPRGVVEQFHAAGH